MTTTAPVPGDCLLSVSQVRQKTSLSRTHIYRLMDAGKFPQAVQITDHRVAWWLSEIDAWTQARPRRITEKAA